MNKNRKRTEKEDILQGMAVNAGMVFMGFCSIILAPVVDDITFLILMLLIMGFQLAGLYYRMDKLDAIEKQPEDKVKNSDYPDYYDVSAYIRALKEVQDAGLFDDSENK